MRLLPLLFIFARCSSFTLDFLPAPASSGFHNSSLWSWGGGVVFSEGAYHLFASAFVGGCTLGSWGSNSVAIHAVGPSPTGPFAFVERALPYYHHNVAPIQAPDGTFLIFAIGMVPDPVPSNCQGASADAATAMTATHPPLSHGFESIECWSSSTVHGPWSPVAGSINGRNLFNGTNPAPAFDPTGSGRLFVMSHSSGNFTVSVAPSWRGPYSPPVPVFSQRSGDYTGEDPFLWYDAKIANAEGGTGAWRVLYHAYNLSDSGHQFNVGGYAQSNGPDIFGGWAVQDPAVAPAYTNNFTAFVSGNAGPTRTVTFSRRERPKVWMDPATGAPAVLFNGACPMNSQDCYTIAAPIAA